MLMHIMIVAQRSEDVLETLVSDEAEAPDLLAPYGDQDVVDVPVPRVRIRLEKQFRGGGKLTAGGKLLAQLGTSDC